MKETVRKGLILALLIGIVSLAFLLRSTQGFKDALVPAGLVVMTLGFTLLASHIFGRLLSNLGLPLITGYLLAGIVLGPEGLGLVSLEVKDRLLTINQIALGLIALSAGGELALGRLRPRLRSIAWVAGLQTSLVLTVTASSLIGFELLARSRGWPTLLPASLDQQHVLAMGLILGLVATANSPASTVAVINELRARGPFTTLAIGTTVVKDVIVILLMALVLMLSKGFVDSAKGFEPALLARVPLEVATSLAVGAALGLLLIIYLARVNKEVALFLLAIVVMAIELVELVDVQVHFHLHFLLIFIAAGFVVENVSEKGDLLIRGLERSSLPIYVIFFTFSGVGLDLASLRLLWPMACAFVLWRVFLLFVSTFSGARLAGEDGGSQRLAWTAFVAQAGISLGLAELVAQQFPHMGAQIRTFVLAAVAINQLVGPVLFGLALRRVGEDGRADESQG
jgi:Kef-type K+ transport system membrane component KefB